MRTASAFSACFRAAETRKNTVRFCPGNHRPPPPHICVNPHGLPQDNMVFVRFLVA